MKIQEQSAEAACELAALRWFQGRLGVPDILHHEYFEGKSYLLMSKVPGKMACSEVFLHSPRKLTDLLAQALQSLWHVDISACPLEQTLDKKLRRAQFNVTNGLVNMADTEPGTFGPEGFESPQALLKWLTEHKPAEEPVLSHGDFCLPNVFIAEDESIYFIDLGQAGISDKWQDIALCYRSLKANLMGKYTDKTYPGFEKNMLFEALGLEPDREKIRYYLLLDELL